MSIQERRQRERDEIRQKIFDAASQMIITEGYEKLSVRKIAEKIQYSPGVIYNYFKDKNEIIRLIIAENHQRICDHIKELRLDAMEPRDALYKGLTTFAWLMLENPQHYRAIMLSGMDLTPFEEEVPKTKSIMELLIHTLENGMQQEVFCKSDAKITAVLLIASILGLVNTIILDKVEGKEVLALMIESQIHILVKGITK